MALDGATLSLIKSEIEEKAINSRIEKISVPSKDEIIISLRWRGGSGKLYLSCSSSNSRVHFTSIVPENPKTPVMFCMLLRKHFGSGRLISIRQEGFDRILFLDFECVNELGDLVINTICIEIMGRHSNIIIINQDGRVIDSMKRIGLETSSVRQILPGINYGLPPSQDKLNILNDDIINIVNRIKDGKNIDLSKSIQNNIIGFSPILSREIAFSVTKFERTLISELLEDDWTRLEFYLNELKSKLIDKQINPTVVYSPDNKLIDFSFISINQYPIEYKTKSFDDIGSMLDFFYNERDRIARVRSKSDGLLKTLSNISERIERRLAVQKEELLQSQDRDKLKVNADIINANLYSLEKGLSKISLPNFYSDDYHEIEIELDERLTPSQNAQKYYALYKKAYNAEKKLIELIQDGEKELEYIDSVFDILMRASGEAEINEIRQELVEQKYIRYSNKKKQKEKRLPPIKYISSDGFTILVGRNNYSNDTLTLKTASKSDMWLHTQKIPGSHVVIVSDGKEIPNNTIEQAAIIAAYHSKARESINVPIDYTFIKNIKKPQGVKPGKVVYEIYQTAFISPNEELVKSLQV